MNFIDMHAADLWQAELSRGARSACTSTARARRCWTCGGAWGPS
jgi:hypothetical protein